MRRIYLFIRYIPAFYRLWKEWGLYPGHIDYALRQYEEVICTLTGGKLSKTCYSAHYIIDEVRENFCDECDEKGNGQQ